MRQFTQGLLFGTVVGGLIGLLNTPRNGKGNRERLQQYLKENTASVDDLSASLNDLKQSVQTLTHEGIGVVDAFTKDLTASLQDFADKNQPRVARVTEKVEKLTEDVKTTSENIENIKASEQEK